MPYLKCTRCGLTAFTTAYWSTAEACVRCGAELPRPYRRKGPARGLRAPSLERDVRERLYPDRSDSGVDRIPR